MARSARDRRAWKEALAKLADCTHYPGLIAVLNGLAHSYKLGIVTNAPRHYAEAAVRQFGLPMPVLAAWHDTALHKPDPAPLQFALDAIGTKPNRAAYVGDEPRDILAAKRCGMTAIAVTWGLAREPELVAEHPHHIVRSPAELQRLLER